MSLPQLALVILVLLVMPGPTNTHFAIAGAERGWRRAVRLIPAELADYLSTVVPLATVGTALLMQAPRLPLAVTWIAAAWLLWLAFSLWREPAMGAGVSVTARRIAVTTLLNPKALVFGLVLLPVGTAQRRAANLTLFAAEVAVVAAARAWLGAEAAGRGARAALPG